MKKILLLIACAALFVAPIVSHAQTDTASAPTVGKIIDDTYGSLKDAASTAWWTAYYIHAPALKNPNGSGVGVFWVAKEFDSTNISVRVLAGTRIDSVNNQLWMPSGNVTIDMPIHPFAWTGYGWAQSFTITPIGYAGIGVPLSGASVGNFVVPGHATDNNGDPTAILGFGFAVHLFETSRMTLDAVYDHEKWSGFEGMQDRFGLALKIKAKT